MKTKLKQLLLLWTAQASEGYHRLLQPPTAWLYFASLFGGSFLFGMLAAHLHSKMLVWFWLAFLLGAFLMGMFLIDARYKRRLKEIHEKYQISED